jgi:hypothetical protein
MVYFDPWDEFVDRSVQLFRSYGAWTFFSA